MIPIDLLDRYELIGPLGQGGGGEVWAARDRVTSDRLAIKALHALSGSAEVEALIRETIALSGLEGLGFPRVLALGRTPDGRLYLVRELVSGQSLEAVARGERDRALSLLPSLAEVLTVVHRTSLLHGDVKPANVIVRDDGTVALVDLGLATALREGGHHALGLTPHFAAPEVLAGGRVTVQSEVYSLGVMLRDLLEQIPVVPLGSEQGRALWPIVERATHHLPSERFPSADEFGSAVRSALRGDAAPKENHLLPWPVTGVEALAYALRKLMEETQASQPVYLVGPAGSGRSTLLRRLGWSLGVEGRNVLLVDAALFESDLLEKLLEPYGKPGSIVFLLPPIHELSRAPGSAAERADRWIQQVHERGAQLVIADTRAPQGAALMELPPLDEASVARLLQGALPSLPPGLTRDLMELCGARPLGLRRFVEAAGGRPLVSRQDIEQVVSGQFEFAGEPAERAERALDRGHYDAAHDALENVSEDSLEGAWLWGRYEIAAGSAQRALRLVEGVLAQVADRPSTDTERARILTLHTRALLGLGKYAEAVELTEDVVSYPLATRAEARAYRGLGQSILGQHEDALATLELSEQEATESGVVRIKALTASSRATAEWRKGALEAAIASYERAILAASRAGDSGMLASAQINLAGLKKEHGDLSASIRLLEAATDAARRAGRKSSLTQALLNLTNADLYLGRLERARAELTRVGDPEDLAPALKAQLLGLRAELRARHDEVEAALPDYDACGRAFETIGRKREASEPYLEAVLLLWQHKVDPTNSTRGVFVPTVEQLRHLLERGRALLESEETPLLILAEAAFLDFQGDSDRAEETSRKAAELAQKAGLREWAWRALALTAELLEQAGKKTRAVKARQEAVEILEEIGARLPPDLREVYWSEPRRRELRAHTSQDSEPLSRGERSPHRSAAGRRADPSQGTGTEAVSRMTQTPLERRLAKILTINSDLASEIDLDRLATKIVAHAAELLGAERGYLLLGKSADELYVRASRSAEQGERLAFSRSIAKEVLSSGQALISIDAGQDQRFKSFESVHSARVAAVACVPVLSPFGVPIGVLYLETRLSSRPDFRDELPTLRAFADQAAIALENARLLGELAEKKEALEKQNQQLLLAQGHMKEVLGKRTQRLIEVREELKATRHRLQDRTGFRGLVGESAAMRRVYALIERVQETDVPVLITGESGTGKEVVARAIHEGSLRKSAKMLAVNCGAIPESILESELFGHKKGAFTGADRDRKGLFLEAEGGSLFLDEVGETPLKMQASLLRVLQERRVRPVGGAEEAPIDVRVIFATNRDLREAVQKGTFREDLLYRIQVVEIALPPLRERKEDIGLLVDHFLQRLSVRFGKEKKTLSREALSFLVHHPLPGNVRQLENTLLNAWVLSEGTQIEADEISLPRGDAPRPRPALEEASVHVPQRDESRPLGITTKPKRGTYSEHQKIERKQMLDALERTNWNRVKAAELLNMPRRTFYRRLRDYGIQ